MLTAQYCLWRRKKYIQQTRLFVRRQRYGDSLRSLAYLSPQEVFDAVAMLGRGAGLKEALSHPDVPQNVKKALRAMLISNATIVGSDAHRTTLRHISSSYRLLFGPPLVFVTPNFADTRSLANISCLKEQTSLAGAFWGRTRLTCRLSLKCCAAWLLTLKRKQL